MSTNPIGGFLFGGYNEPIGSGDDYGPDNPAPVAGLQAPSPRPQSPAPGGPAAAMAQFLRQYGLTEISAEEVTIQQAIESGLSQAGADVNDPAVAALMEDPELHRMVAASMDPDNPQNDAYSNRLIGLYASVAQQYGGAPATDYQMALQAYGFEDPNAPKPPPVQPSATYGIGGALGASANMQKAAKIKAGAEMRAQKTSSGAKMFPNGVIVDPNQIGASGMPQVFFPENDAKVAGSQAWIIKANKTWGPDQVQQQVQELIKYGYLDKQYKGSKTMSIEVMTALKNFHTARYALGNGKPVPMGPQAAGAGGGGLTPEENLRNIRASLTQEVRNQYQVVFGPDYEPKPAELKQWTEFVIRAGNKLQQTKGLSTATAAQEAMAQATARMEKQPAAEWDEQIAEEQGENTQMRDGLIAAAGATSGIIGWGG